MEETWAFLAVTLTIHAGNSFALCFWIQKASYYQMIDFILSVFSSALQGCTKSKIGKSEQAESTSGIFCDQIGQTANTGVITQWKTWHVISRIPRRIDENT